MPISIDCESTLTLTEATKVIPLRNGRRPSIPTVWRWCRRGINGVRMEYIRVGRNIVTSREAISRFFEAVAQADRPVGDPPAPKCEPANRPSIRRASLAEADRILDAAGI